MAALPLSDESSGHDLLVTEAFLSQVLVERVAVAGSEADAERLGGVLVRMNLATERQIAKALAYQLAFIIGFKSF